MVILPGSRKSAFCRHSKAPFTFIMQIMFGSPSLSLTFSWAAPLESSQTDFHSPPLKKLASDSELTSEDIAADEGELLGKPFELTLAR